MAYAFAPPFVAHLGHLNLVSAQWPPLALLCLSSVVRESRAGRTRHRAIVWAGGLGSCFTASGLFGVYFFYFTIVALVIAGFIYALFALCERDKAAIVGLLLAVSACAVAGLLLLPVLLPYLRLHEDLGLERRPEEIALYSAEAPDYLAVAETNALNAPVLSRFHRNLEHDLFPGLGLLVLAAIGLTNRRGGRERWVLLAVTLGAVLLSFGMTARSFGREWPLPYQVLYDLQPGFRAIRVPARFGLLALVGLGGLAGLGVDQLWRVLRPRLLGARWLPWRLATSRIALGALVVVVAVAGLGIERITRLSLPEPPAADAPAAFIWMREHPAPSVILPISIRRAPPVWPVHWATQHWNPVVDGYSGVFPPTFQPMRDRLQTFPSPDTLALLQGIGVTTVVLRSSEYEPAAWAAVVAEIERYPELSLVLDGPDRVYILAPDPWLWRLAWAIPSGVTVDLPDVAPDPLVFGFLMAILQRTGHDVAGTGQIHYLTLSPPSGPQCFAVLHQEVISRAAAGYLDAVVVARERELSLYQRPDCR
jgi:hypothetical protein